MAPSHRGKGLAKKIAEAGLSTDAAKSCRFFEAGVEPENAASIHVLKSLGFENVGSDEDGMLLFRRGGLPFPSQPPLSRLLDLLMLPVMYLVAGTFEHPQRTHRWNVRLLSGAERAAIDHSRTLHVPGDPAAGPRWWGKLPIFHVPILGGWREYVALEPVDHRGEWRLGWLAGDATGVSMIPLSGPVRALRGSGESAFFGVGRDGEQLPLREIGRGRIGDGGAFGKLELL